MVDVFPAALEAEFHQAEAHCRRGEYEAALALYQKIVGSRLRTLQPGHRLVDTMTAADIVIWERLGDLTVLFGNTAAADSIYESIVAMASAAGNAYLADYMQIKRVALILGSGDLRTAYELLKMLEYRIGDVETLDLSPSGLLRWEQALVWPATTRDDQAVIIVQLYLVMGQLLVALGQYTDGLNVLERGLAYSDQNSPALAQATSIPLTLTIAKAFLERGDLQNAHRRLGTLDSRLDAKQHPGFFIQRCELSGKLDLLQGNLGEAQKKFQTVLEICHEKGFVQGSLQASLNIVHVLILLNQTQAAQTILAVVLERAQSLASYTIIARSIYLSHVAQARIRSFGDADALPQSVFTMVEPSAQETQPATHIIVPPPELEQSANYLAFFEDRVLQFHWYTEDDELALAENFLENLYNTFKVTDSALIHLRLDILGGMLCYYQGKIARANTLLEEAALRLQQLGLKPELWQVQRFLLDCKKQLGYAETELTSLARENDGLLHGLAQSLPKVDKSIYLLNKWSADEESLLQEINYLQVAKTQWLRSNFILRPWRRWQLMKQLNWVLHRIDRYKDTSAAQTIHSDTISSVGDDAAFPLWRRLFRHPRDRATITFLSLPDRVFVARATWLSLDFAVRPVTRIQIREWVQKWHQQAALINGDHRYATAKTAGQRAFFLVQGTSSRPTNEQIEREARQEVRKITQDLTAALHLPGLLDSLPKRISGLTIVPDDILHGFPFAATLYNGEYLINRFSLSIAYDSKQIRLRHKQAHVYNALAIGVSGGAPGIAPLPGVRRELERVIDWFQFKGSINHKIHVHPPLVDHTAEKTAILRHLPETTLLHVACHGIFEPDQPDQSGLVLVPSQDDVQVLSLRELSLQDLRSLQHVTLSSCWSADHFVLPGRWIISLPETLWRAGAHSILGSLWEVSDQVAVSFMTRFYAYLENYNRDEALRRTQLDCLFGRLPNCENFDTSIPFFWAGYNLYGDYHKLVI